MFPASRARRPDRVESRLRRQAEVDDATEGDLDLPARLPCVLRELREGFGLKGASRQDPAVVVPVRLPDESYQAQIAERLLGSLEDVAVLEERLAEVRGGAGEPVGLSPRGSSMSVEPI
jgi:hypothetical protein